MLLLLVLNPYTDLVRERGIVWVCAHVNNNKIEGETKQLYKVKFGYKRIYIFGLWNYKFFTVVGYIKVRV